MTVSAVVLGGLDLNATDGFGVLWAAAPIRGWQGPASTIQTAQRPRGDGAWAGDAFRAARHIVIEGDVLAPTPEALDDALDRLNAAASLSGSLLTVTDPIGDRSCVVRRSDEVLAPKITPLYARWSVQLVATDPRKFGTPLTNSTALPSSTGGLTFPHTFAHTYPTTMVTGQLSLTNPGNIAGPVTLRISGPVTGPIVTHVGTGRALTFASSVVLGSGEWIDVDMERRTVLANGQSSRSGWVTSRGWSSFEPGVNVWSFTAAAYHASSLLSVTASPAWE